MHPSPRPILFCPAAPTLAPSRARQVDSLAGAVGEDQAGRHRRMLPEDDPPCDGIDDSDDLIRCGFPACGEVVEPAEVGEELWRTVAET